MSPHQSRDPWTRLVAAARQVPDERDTAAPYGFSTRVIALAFSSERRMNSLFDRFALRALGIACVLAIASVAINYSAMSTTSTTDEPVAAEDPMAVLLDA